MDPSDGLSPNAFRHYSHSDLVNVIMAKIDRIALLQKELATATWQAQLLVDQRDAIMAFMKQEEESGFLRGPDGADCRWIFGQIYRILITDPKDEVPHEN